MIFCPNCGNTDKDFISVNRMVNMIIYSCQRCGKSFDDLLLREIAKKMNEFPNKELK